MQNKTVLQHITIANALLNLDEPHDIYDRLMFYSGDWLNYIEMKDDTKFDYILSSETIYNPDNYEKFLETIKRKLSPNGTCFVAAKIYYFGVGGGSREFHQYLNSDGTFNSEVVFSNKENVKREILKITFKDNQ